ncbi:hypothetical protein GJ744_011803 [Endocarpon pusillum]|uniref:Uncharacterized protein n=1 Tax=Endocarpon pusillum TaxID=364733 RepID=A0A8H7DY43_9EURO|nr:hypothetical protein GJ744_011803 [Endocarpon pusillum]
MYRRKCGKCRAVYCLRHNEGCDEILCDWRVFLTTAQLCSALLWSIPISYLNLVDISHIPLRSLELLCKDELGSGQ